MRLGRLGQSSQIPSFNGVPVACCMPHMHEPIHSLSFPATEHLSLDRDIDKSLPVLLIVTGTTTKARKHAFNCLNERVQVHCLSFEGAECEQLSE